MREGRVAVERMLGKGLKAALRRDTTALLQGRMGLVAETPARDGRNFEQHKARHWGFPTQNNWLKQHCGEKFNTGLLAGKTEGRQREKQTFFSLKNGELFWGH